MIMSLYQYRNIYKITISLKNLNLFIIIYLNFNLNLLYDTNLLYNIVTLLDTTTLLILKDLSHSSSQNASK